MSVPTIQEFKRAHKTPLNVWFHVVCAFVFVVAFIRLLPFHYHNFAIGIYSGFAFLLYTNDDATASKNTRLPLVLVLFAGLFSMNFWFEHARFDLTAVQWSAVALGAFFAPELSHFAAGEHTVLSLKKWPSITDIVLNAATLLPFSLASTM